MIAPQITIYVGLPNHQGIIRYLRSPFISVRQYIKASPNLPKSPKYHGSLSRLTKYHGSSSIVATMPMKAICRCSPRWQCVNSVNAHAGYTPVCDNAHAGYMSIQPMLAKCDLGKRPCRLYTDMQRCPSWLMSDTDIAHAGHTSMR